MAINANVVRKMQCIKCKKEMTWGGDHDIDDSEEYDIVSNYFCNKCETSLFYYTKNE